MIQSISFCHCKITGLFNYMQNKHALLLNQRTASKILSLEMGKELTVPSHVAIVLHDRNNLKCQNSWMKLLSNCM